MEKVQKNLDELSSNQKKKKDKTKNKVFLMRHGHVLKDKTIDVKRFDGQASKNAELINRNISLELNNFENFIFYCSSHVRCVQTAEIIISKMKEINPNIKTIIEKDDHLLRWDKKNESREESFVRSNKYGQEIKKMLDNQDGKNCYFFVTHSSILFTLVEGLIGKEIKKKMLKGGAIYAINYKKNKISEQDTFKKVKNELI